MSVKFQEENHCYLNNDNEQYISVSGIQKLLEVPKDWIAIRKKQAKKLGISEEELKNKWENARIKGTEAGTAIHKMREQGLLNTNDLTVNNVKCNIKPCSYSDGWKYSLLEDKLENNTIYPEALIYDHDLKIAGQADIVEVINNHLNVLDYKTDKKINRVAYSSEWVSPEKLLAPVNHLDNCEFNVYSLKMSMYMYLLWKKNKHLKIGKLILIWEQLLRDEDGIPILDENNNPQVIKKEEIEVPYRRKEVKDIFDWWKQGKLK